MYKYINLFLFTNIYILCEYLLVIYSFEFKYLYGMYGSHGALYKVLGEMEVRQQKYIIARETFSRGLTLDPHCAPLYHAAALLEAILGNLGVLHIFLYISFIPSINLPYYFLLRFLDCMHSFDFVLQWFIHLHASMNLWWILSFTYMKSMLYKYIYIFFLPRFATL